MTTCHSLVSTTLKVQMSPSLILFSWQNLFQPSPPRWLQLLYGITRAFQDVVLLTEVLRVIVHGSLSPRAAQKVRGKDCIDCNTFFSQMVSVSQCSRWMYVGVTVNEEYARTFLECIHMTHVVQVLILYQDKYFSIRFVSYCDSMHTQKYYW